MRRVEVDGEGEVMALVVEQGRPCILIGPPDNPDVAELVYIGPRFFRARAALRHGKTVYFQLYLERYGFRHPEDPHAPAGVELPASVAVLKSTDNGEARVYSETYDPDQRRH